MTIQLVQLIAGKMPKNSKLKIREGNKKRESQIMPDGWTEKKHDGRELMEDDPMYRDLWRRNFAKENPTVVQKDFLMEIFIII